MEKRIVIALVALNALLALVAYRSPAGPQMRPAPTGPANCCRGEGPEAYCCERCCWFGPGCQSNAECGGEQH